MSRRLRAPLLAAVLSSLVVAVPAASGATFCVGSGPPCPGTMEPTIQAALNAAADVSGRDRVLVYPVGSDGDGFTIAAGNAVDVVRGSEGPEFLRGNARVVVDEPTAVLDGLFFSVSGVASPAIDLRRGTWRGGGAQAGPREAVVRLGDATLDGVNLSNGTAVRAVGPGGVIKDSVLSGETALASSSDGLVVQRSRLEGVFMATPDSGAVRVTAGRVTFDGTDLSASGPATGLAGIDVAPAAGGHADVVVRGAMLHGEGQPAPAVGARATCVPGATATIALVGTEVSGFGTAAQGVGSGCVVSVSGRVDDPPLPPLPPEPPAPPVTTPAVPSPPALSVALLDHRLRSPGRALRVRVRCDLAAGCHLAGVVLRAGATTLGRTGALGVAAGATRTVAVAVGAAGRRLLRRHPHGVAVRVLVLQGWTNGEGGTVRP